MRIYKVLKIVILSLIVVGINTQVSYSTQRITVVPKQTYYPTGATGETFEFSLDTANYVYASDASGSPLTISQWTYPTDHNITGLWTGDAYTRQWTANITTGVGQYFVVLVSGYYMPKGLGKGGEARWIPFTSTANNTVIKPHIGVTTSEHILIIDISGRPPGVPKTSTITAKVLDNQNQIITTKTGTIRFQIPDMVYGALLDLNNNLVTSVDVPISSGQATVTFKVSNIPSGSSPVIITAKDAAIPANMTEGYTSITVDPILNHVGITVVIKGDTLLFPYKVPVGEQVTFTANSYTNNDNSILWDGAMHEPVQYLWIVDGTQYNGNIIAHTFPIIGIHTTQLTGIVRSGTSALQSKSTTINIEVYSVDYIKVTPANGYVSVGGKLILFSAYGYWNGSDGVSNTGDDVNLGIVESTWTTSVSSNIGVIDPSNGGFTSGTNTGSGTVTATYNSLTANANVYVTGVDYIELKPKDGYATVGGGYEKYTIIGYWNGPDGISHTPDDEFLGELTASSWSTSVSSNVGIIDATGKFTPGDTPGTGTVTATYNLLSANGTITVTSCGDSSRITIGATFKEDLGVKEEIIGSTTIAGATKSAKVNTFKPTFDVCLDSAANLWRVRVTGLAYLSYDMYVQEEGWQSPPRKDIASATDQDINTENVCAVITDLTPDSYTYKPPRNTYWCRPNTQLHEDYHLYNQWIYLYIGYEWSMQDGIEDKLEGEINCSYITGSIDTPEKAHAVLTPIVNKRFDNMYLGVWEDYGRDWIISEIETGAYKGTAYAYRILVDDIKNTWPMTLNAPTLNSVSISGTTATLRWADNSCNEDKFIASASILVGDVGISRESEVPANATSATITNLFSGTWSFVVIAKRGNQSSFSNIINATVP